MLRINLLAATIVVLFCLVGIGTSQEKAHKITPEDVLSIRELRDARVSPDGKEVAFVVIEPAGDKTPGQPRASNIWVIPTDGHESPRQLIPGLTNVSSPRWSPDGRTLAFLSDRARPGDSGEANVQIYLFGKGDENAVRLSSVPGGVEQFEW